MNLIYLLAESQGGGQVAQIAQTFGVDWSHLIAQTISFSIVCLILYKFAYTPVLQMLEQRRELIAQGLANTEKIKAELAKTEAQRQVVLDQANDEARKLMEQVRDSAARLREQETQKATAAAEQITTKARQAAASDYTRMLAQLKREVGRLVVETTAAIAGKVLTTDDQRRLAEETARELSGASRVTGA